ncbi:MAG TPA: hypothetical protein VEQ59_15795 [Polyangiaceae bacterium]|nr:hypothetical protein [Polyangiaceae bacterium]
MPISVQITRGLLTSAGERELLPRLAQALLDAHGLADNSFMRPNVVGHLTVCEESAAYVGGKPQSLATIAVIVPSLAFGDREVQQRFIAAATRLVDELKAGPHPKERTFVTVSHAVDGAWGIAGRAYTNDDLGQAIGAAAG